MTETQQTQPETTATPNAVSGVSAFKRKAQGTRLALPSDPTLVVLARRVELRTFIKQGNVPNGLMSIVESTLAKGGELDVEKLIGADGAGVDMKSLTEMYDLIDVIVSTIVIEPKINLVPEDASLRDESMLYTDEIDDEDKMYLFQWATGGTADHATFREEAAATMASLAAMQGHPLPTQ